MLRYFETTTLILGWCFVLSLGWALGLYATLVRRPRDSGNRRAGLGAGVILPALVAAPLVLTGAFRGAGLNLLFPVHFFADLWTLLAAALAPALVLCLSSGLAGVLRRDVAREVSHWRGKPFALMATAVGQSQSRALRRLVVTKALSAAWSQCLPWLFGELIVVESVFNAPGLGLDAWHLARVRDFGGLAGTVAWLAGLYAVCVVAAALVSRRLGRRLESYG